MPIPLRVATLAALLMLANCCPSVAADAPGLWPEPTAESRPWTRWWWLGSAVDKQEITRLLQEYHDAGIGGVEITCIYGVQGEDEHELPYRSEAWLGAVQHAIAEADRLGMGVDLPPGSGWRMGGPEMSREQGNSRLVLSEHEVAAGETLSVDFDRERPQAAVAVGPEGRRANLSEHLTDSRLEWQADADSKVYVVAYRWAGDRVKRPAPGGEGVNINPFWADSVRGYLNEFSSTAKELPGLRASFHDSFEYEGDWQPDFFTEFHNRRGYRLEDRLAELNGVGPSETVARVKCDYRETLSDLVRDHMLLPWIEWSHEHGLLARNQSHGSPANWLDLYGLCDIPETESFGRLTSGDTNPLVMKFASSAANTMGKRLTSSESGTWLNEHFHVTLAELKQLLDRQMTAGVNHAIYHGTAYSPERAQWPGWLFYASTQVNPQNPLWRDLPALNAYMTRCQSLLQASQPDNDVLLYWPIHDYWHNPRGLRSNMSVHSSESWLDRQPIGEAAAMLVDNGYGFDFISDAQLQQAVASGDNAIRLPGGEYRVVVAPKPEHMPLKSLAKLSELAQAGAKVVFWGGLPSSEPGLAGLEESDDWKNTTAMLKDSGDCLRGEDLLTLLKQTTARGEQVPAGLSILRKKADDASLYMVVNTAGEPFDGWFAPAGQFEQAVLLDPMTGDTGVAEGRAGENGHELRLQLAPGESLFVRCEAASTEFPAWVYTGQDGQSIALDGPADVEFIAGGPTLPGPQRMDIVQPWTALDLADAQRFAGTARYAFEFDVPAEAAEGDWRLDLGEVAHSARVRLNGGEPRTLIGPTFQTQVGPLKSTGNRLEVEVTSTATNRIRDLDGRGIPWRIFKDINLVTIRYRKFDASGWPVQPQGLIGPVKLTKVTTD
ncbi:hypothetical protein KOR34_25890 [Posidoniimonas corsicana]|uniref:Glycosyl hydrolases family 2, sugar binding domain n=1 Tax=Posidoniimonas corsicana TaxID=1938618 RepID=A0A5C5VHZ8_9BACT|nr:glycosyl hydrolase [Posidoniimonas corsicana]TWT37633.1 hypothetical protein KOR34_25890 [Posidoniimonas corsicana]